MDFKGIAVAIIIFLIVIMFHELGHFLAAKSVGIKVNEFAVGMGPAIWKKQKGETLYALRALPLGGFCAMEGEDDESSDPRSFDRATPGARFKTIFAGPFVNLVIAALCFIIFLMMTGKPQPVIEGFTPNSPLQEAGAQVGERITSINGMGIDSYDQMVAKIQSDSAKKPLQGLKLVLSSSSGEARQITVMPVKEGERYLIGIRPTHTRNFFDAVVSGITMVGSLFIQLFHVLGRLLTGKLSLNNISGPIGVVMQIGESTKQGLSMVIFYTGYISLNLGFFNLLPIPALDGSKLILIIIEKLRGKPLNKTVETRVTIAGFLMLISLIVLVSIKDIMRIFS